MNSSVKSAPARKPPKTGAPGRTVPAAIPSASKPAASGKAGGSALAGARSKSLASGSVGVQSLTAKKAAPSAARTGSKSNVGKATARTSIKEVQNAAREVDSKATSSGSKVSAGRLDIVEKPVVLKVSEVATKTPKTTPAAQPLLTEEQILKMAEKDYMNEAQLAFFKARLKQLEKDLLKNADETTEHLRETVLVPDPADRATIEEEHALELRTRDRERKLLKKVQQSIVSIDNGEYGWCEETGEPIGIPRLLARPTATLSLEAQQRRELKQKLYGD
nr:RNA polymerase-binding protein DksA [Herbaspirillum chlorophenolicum]